MPPILCKKYYSILPINAVNRKYYVILWTKYSSIKLMKCHNKILCNTLKEIFFDKANEMPPTPCKKYYEIPWKKYSSMMPIKCHK